MKKSCYKENIKENKDIIPEFSGAARRVSSTHVVSKQPQQASKTLKRVQGLSDWNKSGFTLIELLVVILIIGILAAIALPQYQRAVEKSRAMEAITILKILRDRQAFCLLEHGIDDGRCAQGDEENNLFTAGDVKLNITGAPDPDCNYDTCGPSTKDFAFFLDGQYILASRKPFETKYELETTAYPGCFDTNKINCTNDGDTNYCKNLGFIEVEEGLWLLP